MSHYPNPPAMRYRPPASLTFAGAHRRAQAGQINAALKDYENTADKESDYWKDMAADYRDRTLAVLTAEECAIVEDTLHDWEAGATAMGRALGWRRAMDHVNLCRLRRWPLYLATIVYRVCGQSVLAGDPATKAQVGYDAR